MRLVTIGWKNGEEAAVVAGGGLARVSEIARVAGKSWGSDLFGLIETGQLGEMNDWYRAGGRKTLEGMPLISPADVALSPLYRRPRKIWGIGLNLCRACADLVDKPIVGEPASFMKPDTTIIGPGDAIEIPLQSEATTAEAELGLIIGRRCKNIEREDWKSVLAGYTTLLDMTAEDILRKNPRYLTRSKSFDTFLSFGPQLVTPDEIGMC
jgi:2-keto-4-pentenoate hydratase/2-oxohepta-3-ene-1,7-dioic acid hydratase in catechol pathway